eukprot:1914708-Prymnesium_polylepis.2
MQQRDPAWRHSGGGVCVCDATTVGGRVTAHHVSSTASPITSSLYGGPSALAASYESSYTWAATPVSST